MVGWVLCSRSPKVEVKMLAASLEVLGRNPLPCSFGFLAEFDYLWLWDSGLHSSASDRVCQILPL